MTDGNFNSVCLTCGNEIPETSKRSKFCSTRCGKVFHKDRDNIVNKERYRRQRIEAVVKVSRGQLFCAECKESDFGELEINHLNGGGKKEVRDMGGIWNFYRAILTGRRGMGDLNILCSRCNHKDGMERIKRMKMSTEARCECEKGCRCNCRGCQPCLSKRRFPTTIDFCEPCCRPRNREGEK